MNYFIDTEFVEGTQKKMFGETKPTIDLISIGVVCEDGREYYAISKDFNLKEAWNRFDIKNRWDEKFPEFRYTQNYKDYWLRKNVLKPIYNELISEEYKSDILAYHEFPFNYSSMKYLIKKYGKSNKQITEEVYEFCSNNYHKGNNLSFEQRKQYYLYDGYRPKFYGFYSVYDWTVFCWLFGKMIDLPTGFPMYCNDLQQTMKEICDRKANGVSKVSDNIYNSIKSYPNYPKQTNEHNALSDARWNRDLYNFLKTM